MQAAPVDQMADDRRAAGWLRVRTTPRANINSLHRSSRARMRTLQAGFPGALQENHRLSLCQASRRGGIAQERQESRIGIQAATLSHITIVDCARVTVTYFMRSTGWQG